MALGFAATVSAQTPSRPEVDDPDPNRSSYGLLGERYTGVAYSYTHLDNSPLDNFNGFALRYNQPMNPGFDFGLGYEWARSNEVGGVHGRAQEFTASVTAFTDYNGMRAFIEPGVGWTWAKVGNARDDSFLYYVGTGVEIQVAAPVVVTPYVQFVDATEFSGNTWNFGVKSAWRLNRDWAITADLSIDDDSNTGYSLGVNYHF